MEQSTYVKQLRTDVNGRVVDSYIRYGVCLEITSRQIRQCNIYIELVSTCFAVSCVITSWLQCIDKKPHDPS